MLFIFECDYTYTYVNFILEEILPLFWFIRFRGFLLTSDNETNSFEHKWFLFIFPPTHLEAKKASLDFHSVA